MNEVFALLGHHVSRHCVNGDHLLHLVVDAHGLEKNNTEENVPGEVVIGHELTEGFELARISAFINLVLGLSGRAFFGFL